MKRNSLRVRLAVSACLLLIVLLPAIGLTLNNVFKKHLVAAIESELSAHSYSILADTEFIDGDLLLPQQLMESRFNVIDTGLYAVVNSQLADEAEIWRSPSALNLVLSNTDFNIPAMGQRSFYPISVSNGDNNTVDSLYFVSSFSVSFSSRERDFPVTLHVISSQTQYLRSLGEFQRQLSTWLVIIAAAFITMIIGWLSWTLKPLRHLTNELKAIEQGEKESVSDVYPDELTPAVVQLNQLLQTEQQQRIRYRNALSDLAHSLKTPLATINSSPSITADIASEVTKINGIVEHQLKRAQSAGQSSWRLSIDVAPCVEKLINAFGKIYREKDVELSVSISEKASFRGDEADLLEILGNLIDNAFKAAASKVSVAASHDEDSLKIIISDDGRGIDENLREQIMQRGTRADTYEQGHGIGLAIVRDVVSSYQGSIGIGADETLGGASFTLSFPLR